jgi:hypothetical protein
MPRSSPSTDHSSGVGVLASSSRQNSSARDSSPATRMHDSTRACSASSSNTFCAVRAAPMRTMASPSASLSACSGGTPAMNTLRRRSSAGARRVGGVERGVARVRRQRVLVHQRLNLQRAALGGAVLLHVERGARQQRRRVHGPVGRGARRHRHGAVDVGALLLGRQAVVEARAAPRRRATKRNHNRALERAQRRALHRLGEIDLVQTHIVLSGIACGAAQQRRQSLAAAADLVAHARKEHELRNVKRLKLGAATLRATHLQRETGGTTRHAQRERGARVVLVVAECVRALDIETRGEIALIRACADASREHSQQCRPSANDSTRHRTRRRPATPRAA